ncbi:MAG: maleylpyruvate isomerase family mycothiol-dependent enzyme [Jatrophihabitans sp.]
MTSLHPAAAGLDYFAEIALHSAALAEAAENDLDAPVAHCPGWTVADLVAHVWQVHWFWSYLAEHRCATPPQVDGPERPERAVLVDEFRAGAMRMIEILRGADQQAAVWTWAPSQQNIGFISRHQVQEAAVHRWDAEHAVGRECALDVPTSVDSIEEFLTFSVATPASRPDQPAADLGGSLALVSTDADASWTIREAELPGSVRFDRGVDHGEQLPTVRASSSELLLWLYRRVVLTATATDQPAATELIGRFRALTFTD